MKWNVFNKNQPQRIPEGIEKLIKEKMLNALLKIIYFDWKQNGQEIFNSKREKEDVRC